jgi:multicomponent Na+:H+ antiporter subunit G
MTQSILDAIVATLLVLGGLFAALAGLGVVRMPDLLTRMQASTKAGTLGLGLITVAAAVSVGTVDFALRALLVMAFFFLTAPVGAHVLSRAARTSGVELWTGKVPPRAQNSERSQ